MGDVILDKGHRTTTPDSHPARHRRFLRPATYHANLEIDHGGFRIAAVQEKASGTGIARARTHRGRKPLLDRWLSGQWSPRTLSKMINFRIVNLITNSLIPGSLRVRCALADLEWP